MRRLGRRPRWGMDSLVASLVLLAGASAVGAQSVHLELNRAEMTIEEQVLVTVTVEDAGRGKPELPTLASFAVDFSGQTDQFSIVNGNISRRLIYQWTLRPKEVGEFEIGPATVAVHGSTVSSGKVRLKVLPASARPRGARPVFLTASVSNTNPYVGEQVIFVWRFYYRARIADPRIESLDLGDFLVEDLGEVNTFQTTEGGMQYEVSEIRKALFAQRPGTFVVPSSRLTLQLVQSAQPRRGIDPFDGRSSPFDEFFGRMRTESVTLVTEPITVTARALPAPPPGFSGLVGDFGVEATVSTTTMAAGESLTQKIVVSGAGNINLMGDLPLDELAGFKVYRDQPQVEVSRSPSGLRGKKTFSRALVPGMAGAAELPETRLVYFDPERESYETATTRAVALEVAPNPNAEELRLTESYSPESGKVAVKILADDLLPIRGGSELLSGRPSTALLSMLLTLPPVGFLGLLLARRRADRLASDVGLRRRRGALRGAMQAIGRRGELPPREASSVLRRYIGDRVGAPGQALTARECCERLAARGAGEAVVAEVRELLERFEAADYGGAAASPVGASELRSVIERLERELRRGQ